MKKPNISLKIVASILVITTLLATISFPTSASAKNDIDSELTYTSDQININHQIEKPIVNDNIIYDNGLVDIVTNPLLCAQDSKILDYVNVESFKTSAHIARIEELEELNTYVFQNADGTRSVYLMNENVKYIDSKGIVKEKDISLIKKDKGYVLAQSNIDLLLPNNPTDGVDIGFSDYDIKLTPQRTNSSAILTARKNDNTVIYDSFFGNNTALAYTPLLSGVKEDIILYSYIDNASFTFVLETDGLGVYNDQKGYYLAENPKDEKVFRIGEIILYDEVGKPGNGYINITTVSEREKYILTVTVDEEYLTDETTVYPVTIDPSITVSDNDTGTNSIVDCPIFEGFPNANYGAYIYNRVGTPSGSYGVGRTAIKLDGLVSSNEYNTISSSQITDVTFYVRASGGSSVYVNVYPITGNTTWTETTLTWYNIGSHDTSVNYGGTLGKNTTNGFNITDLVKAWKDGTYSSSAGFVMISSDESSNKSFCSSEYSDTTKRPYVVMTYETDLSISDSQLNVYEGGTITLTATSSPAGQPVTWSSSNTLVATVDQSGVVTGVSAGQANISATYTDTDGVTHTLVCIVYVILPNGVYYFNNVASDYGIEFVDEYSYGEFEPLTVWDGGTEEPEELFRMFKISHLGNGIYSIRSMLDSTMGWTRSGATVVCTTIGTSNTTVIDRARWYIRTNSNGYYIQSYVGTPTTVTCPDDPDNDWNLILQSYSPDNTRQNWTINKVTKSYNGVIIREKTSKIFIDDTFTFTATMHSSNNDIFGQRGISWSVTDYSGSATIDSTTGEFTCVSSGVVVVEARYKIHANLECIDYCIVTIYASTDVNSIRMTRDATDMFTLCVATLYNDEKYWFQIDDDGGYSDVLLLSDDNINWLNENYDKFANELGSVYSIEYCVYQAKHKLDNSIANGQLYNVSQSSYEYNGLWLFFSLVEANYREAIILAVQGFNTMMMFVDIGSQAYVLANNINVLANARTVHNAAQYLSGMHAIEQYAQLTDAQAISEGITDVAEYVGKRPTWRQSETYASLTRFKQESGYKYNYSCMLDEIGKLIEVKYGTKDSIRPDFYNEYTKHCVDIKNYTITTPEGRSKLVSNVISQYNERKSILPPDVKYEVVIDVRGQSWEQSHLDDITRRIKEQSNDKITVSYFK